MVWLDLGCTQIGDAFVRALAERGVLQRLRSLSLEQTAITDAALLAVADALRAHCKAGERQCELREFTTWGCEAVTDEGVDALLQLAQEGVRVGGDFLAVDAPQVTAAKAAALREMVKH